MRIFNVGKPKKASLDLSLNAIVILILAIALLGLGLTFIRGIFKGITAKVEEAVSAGEITNPPTRDNPTTVTPSTLVLRQGETGQVKVAFMNTLADFEDFTLSVTETSATPSQIDLIYNPDSLRMAKDQINLWTIALGTKDAQEGTYLFTAKMSGLAGFSYSRDFIVTIKP